MMRDDERLSENIANHAPRTCWRGDEIFITGGKAFGVDEGLNTFCIGTAEAVEKYLKGEEFDEQTRGNLIRAGLDVLPWDNQATAQSDEKQGDAVHPSILNRQALLGRGSKRVVARTTSHARS